MSRLLPNNSTNLEKLATEALAQAQALDVPIRSLYDPWGCPLLLLPYLAWALSVDYWDENWDENTKRMTCDASFDVHKLKGTSAAVRHALSIFGYTAEFKEWFNQIPEGEAGTFELVVNLNQHGIDPVREKEVARLIDATKPLSRHISQLSFAMASSGRMRFAAALFAGEVVTIYPYSPKQLSSSGTTTIAAILQIIETTTLKTGAAHGL